MLRVDLAVTIVILFDRTRDWRHGVRAAPHVAARHVRA
jgi:hypothetical protein